MTVEPPPISTSARLSISQACQILEIHRDTLAKYTALGYIKCKYRKSGRKYYQGLEIIKFWNSTI